MGSRRAVGPILLMAVVAAVGASLARAEERTIRAVAPWEARGRVFVTGPQQAFLLGVFAGRLTVEKGSNPVDGAQLRCPTAVDADYAANTQRGEGRCIITTGSGDRLFARWTCTGEPDRGCAGRFVLTGGTGPYQGVAGGGDFVLRIVLSNLIQFERLEAEYDLAGLASWPELKYRTP
jgi:hypothetical protein